MSKTVDVTITYLRQEKRPPTPPPRGIGQSTAILRAAAPPVSFYRYLYDLVGRPYFWVSRARMPDDELAEIIRHPQVYVYVLYIGGVPAGMAEVDFRTPPEALLRFFGIDAAHHGKGVGRYFLEHILALAWSLSPASVSLETCTLDHPAALPLYQKMGFTVFDQRKGQIELTDADTK